MCLLCGKPAFGQCISGLNTARHNGRVAIAGQINPCLEKAAFKDHWEMRVILDPSKGRGGGLCEHSTSDRTQWCQISDGFAAVSLLPVRSRIKGFTSVDLLFDEHTDGLRCKRKGFPLSGSDTL